MEGAKTIDDHVVFLEMEGLAHESKKRKGKGKALRQVGESSKSTKPKPKPKTKTKTIETQNLRRSVRINGRSPQTKFHTPKKGKKGENSGAAERKRMIQETMDEAAILAALEEENLRAKPLEEIMALQNRSYCGIMETPNRAQVEPEKEVGQGEAQAGQNESWSTYREESVLNGLDDKVMEDLSDEED